MELVLYPRALERLIHEELLRVFPAVLITGPRGSGKSTSAGLIADVTLDLSLPQVRDAAYDDPDSLLASVDGVVLIDEWQEEPGILGAVKRSIDKVGYKDSKRFVIAGSVRARNQTQTWPGTGRIMEVRMYGLTQAEMAGDSRYNPVDFFFSAEPPQFARSDMSQGDYLERIVAGRFPEVLDTHGRDKSRWFSSYVERLVDRDALQVSDKRIRPANLRTVFKSCAARTGQQLNKTATATDAGVNVRTADHYINLLEDLSIIIRVPAWNAKPLRRVTQSPKVHLTDTGLACYALNADEMRLREESGVRGQLFESYVAAEIAAHIETAQEETHQFHFRDQNSRYEVDVILEQFNRIVALEVKSGVRIKPDDVRGLMYLREKLGERFHYGAVLCCGETPYRLSDRIWALPISSLWQPPKVTSN